MKVLLVNGSPHKTGTTFTALNEISATLEKNGISSEIFWIGNEAIHGCMACGKCAGNSRCVFNDSVNVFIEKAKDADGFVFGTPVYYAAASGQITSFLNRAFFAGGKDVFRLKPAASVSVARRAGCTSAFDQLNKYFAICEMPIVTSVYWNMVFGSNGEQAKEDAEGLQTMRALANNMAYLLKVKEAGQKAGITLPEQEKPRKTNFIR